MTAPAGRGQPISPATKDRRTVAQTGAKTPVPEPMRSVRTLGPAQKAELYILDVETEVSKLVLSSTDILFEAPNWHPDGRAGSW